MTAHEHAKQLPVIETQHAHIHELDPVGIALEDAVSRGASSQEIAEVVGKAFQDIAQVLAPIIGQRGVVALYRRSLHVAGRTSSQAPAPTDAVPMATDIELLERELANLTSAEAATAGAELLRAFYGLLTTLIGQSLTERLLRSVWTHFSSGPSAGNTKP